MMGMHEPQKEMFSYQVDLDKRVRSDHPLRRINQVVDWNVIRGEVKECYGYNGNVSVDPAQVMKLLFLLFYDDVPSERELMKIVRERLDYLWFLGWGLDDEVPDHSVLSKARKRWGPEVFERLFVRIVQRCVEAGLVEGKKIHMDGSLIAANASKGSVVKGSPELIAALRQVYRAEERKLDESENLGSPYYEAVNDRVMSTTDPDSALVRKDGESRPRYKQHRVVDNAQGVITAVKTTAGDVKENGQLMAMVEQHERNTDLAVGTIVADTQYGTAENFRTCYERGIRSHMADFQAPQLGTGRREGIFAESDFRYNAATDTYRCPGDQTLTRRKHKQTRQAYEYSTNASVCRTCPLRAQCTRANGTARTIKRHMGHEAIEAAREQSHSEAARRDRVRRKWLMEGSFADAANNHGFKRARWRRLWRQQIQDYLIATVQNVRILLRNAPGTDAARELAIEKRVPAIHGTVPMLYLVLRAPRESIRDEWSLN
jgi:transposase